MDDPEISKVIPIRPSAESDEENQRRMEHEGWSNPHKLSDIARLRAARRAQERGETTYAVNADDVLHVLDAFQEQVSAAIAEIADKLSKAEKPTIWTPGR
jgi:hypothetical protein